MEVRRTIHKAAQALKMINTFGYFPTTVIRPPYNRLPVLKTIARHGAKTVYTVSRTPFQLPLPYARKVHGDTVN